MSHSLPQSVRVAAFDIAIIAWPHTAAAAAAKFGEFSSLELCIRVDASVAPIKLIDTLIHEINHAIYWAYGIDDADKEERLVATMATAWTQIYRDNPALLTMIREVFGHAEVGVAGGEGNSITNQA